VKPFNQTKNNDHIYRQFDANTDSNDLVWHRDDKDREVHIVEGNGWKFQHDNQLPQPLNEGDIIHIKKGNWHRIIKGDGDLKIKIFE